LRKVYGVTGSVEFRSHFRYTHKLEIDGNNKKFYGSVIGGENCR